MVSGDQITLLGKLLSIGFILSASTVGAQDAGGMTATASFSQGLTFSDQDGTLGRTDLGFGLTSETRTQKFDFSISSGFVQDFEGNRSLFEVTDPRASLSYSLESRQSVLTSSLTYRRSDVDTFVEDTDGVPGVPGVLILDEGTRENLGGRLGLVFGQEAKFGGALNLGYDQTVYSDTTSTDLVDFDRTSARLRLRFEIDRRITTTLNYSRSLTDRDSGRDLKNERLTFGGEFAVTPTLDAKVDLGASRVAVDDNGIESVEDGLSFGVTVTQDRPLGDLRFSLGSDISESGRRTTLNIGGAFETRRGVFDASIGLTESEDTRIRPTLTLSYGEELKRLSYDIAVNQAFDTNAAGDETLNSQLRLSLRQELTQTSRLTSNMTYQATDVLGQDEDTSRFEFGVGFNHDLTEDWALTTRYTHAIIDDDNAIRTRENEIYIGLETSFGWRP